MDKGHAQLTVGQQPSGASEASRIGDIETLFHEVAALVKSELDRDEFASRFLHYAMKATGAEGGIVWELTDRDELIARRGSNGECLQLGDDKDAEEHHAQFVRSVFAAARYSLVPPQSMTDSVGTAFNPTPYILLAQPLMLTDKPAAVVEMFLSPETAGRQQRAAIEIIGSLADLAAEFYLRAELRRSSGSARTLEGFEAFAAQIYGASTLDSAASALVNEGRRFLECDRVSLVLRGRWRSSVRAISGIETISRRSNAVRRLEELVASVLRGDGPFHFVAGQTETPQALQEPLRGIS